MARIIEAVRRAVIDAMIECVCGEHRAVCLLDDNAQRCSIQPFIYGS